MGRESEPDSVHQFTAQTPITTKSRSGQRQNIGTPSRSLRQVAGTLGLAHLSAAISKQWDGSEAARP